MTVRAVARPTVAEIGMSLQRNFFRLLKMTSPKNTRLKRRPAFEPTEDQRNAVLELASFGVKQAIICGFILDNNGKPISEPTLRKYFAHELDHGTEIATAKVAAALYRDAINGNTTAQIFWLKCRGKGQWNDRQTVELTGPNGEPLGAPVPPSIMVMFEEGPGDAALEP